MTFSTSRRWHRHMLGAALLACSVAAAAQSGSSALNDSTLNRIDPAVFGITSDEIATIRGRMQAAVDGEHIAGALLLVGNNDGIGVLESVGNQGPQDATPVSEQTLFRIYSMTKPIVSVAAMSLVEDGLLSVDDPVSKYLPEFTQMTVIDAETGEARTAEREMTVAHLLSHTSGLVQAIFAIGTDLGTMYQQNIHLDGSLTNREIASRLADLPLLFEPGTAWHYGHSTDLLGAVLEIAAGQPLDDILEQRIFTPLGMDDTGFWVPVSEQHRVAEPIHGAMPDNTVQHKFLSGGGGLNSTAEDYVRFARMLLNDGEYGGARILEPATLAVMTEERITDEVSREHFFYGNRGGWSLGFHLQPIDPANPAAGTNFGWRGIGGTLFLVDPVNDFFMIYMEQKRGGPRDAPFDNSTAQSMVYEAILN